MDVVEINRNCTHLYWQKQETANVSEGRKKSQDGKRNSTSNIDTFRRKLKPQAGNSWLTVGEWGEVSQNDICERIKALRQTFVGKEKLNYVEMTKKPQENVNERDSSNYIWPWKKQKKYLANTKLNVKGWNIS